MDPAMPFRPRLTAHYAFPKEAIRHRLRLPVCAWTPPAITLSYRTFVDGQLRWCELALIDLPLPQGLTTSSGGLAVVTTTGTLLHALIDGPLITPYVERFLTENLSAYAFDPTSRCTRWVAPPITSAAHARRSGVPMVKAQTRCGSESLDDVPREAVTPPPIARRAAPQPSPLAS